MKKETITIELSKLKKNPKNPRVHSEIQIKEIQRSLKMFGQYRTIVCDAKFMILAGHGLYEAMVQRGDKEAEVTKYTGISEQMKSKLLLADNKNAVTKHMHQQQSA